MAPDNTPRSVRLRSLATQLIEQLPKKQADARQVIKYMDDLVENFLFVEDQTASDKSSGKSSASKSNLAIFRGNPSGSPK